MTNPVFINCLFAKNRADGRGGVIINSTHPNGGQSRSEFHFCTLADNEATKNLTQIQGNNDLNADNNDSVIEDLKEFGLDTSFSTDTNFSTDTDFSADDE